MRGAGERDELISFHEIVTGENSFGEPAETGLALLCEEWARVTYGRAEERRAAAIEGADQVAVFNVLANDETRAVTTDHVIRFDDSVWDITSAAPWKREEIEFTAIRRAQ